MWTALKSALKDIVSGQHLDLYFSLILAVVVLLLAALGKSPFPGVQLSDVVINVILIVLAVLAYGALEDRRARNAITSTLGQLSTEVRTLYLARGSILRQWNDIQPLFDSKLERASRLDCVIIDPDRFVQNYKHMVAKILDRKDGSVRLIAMSPELGNTATALFPDAALRARLKTFFSIPLEQSLPGADLSHIEVRECMYEPPASISIVVSASDATAFVTLRGLRDKDRPAMVLTANDGQLHSFFVSEFDKLWAKSTARKPG
jgi:hypothetical protein